MKTDKMHVLSITFTVHNNHNGVANHLELKPPQPNGIPSVPIHLVPEICKNAPPPRKGNVYELNFVF